MLSNETPGPAVKAKSREAPKALHMSVIIQREPSEIVAAALDRGAMSQVIPNLQSLFPNNDLHDNWTLRLQESNNMNYILQLKRDSDCSLSWEVFHPSGAIEGSINFTSLPFQRGTKVDFYSSGRIPKESVFKILSHLFSDDEDYSSKDIIRRFKSFLESGQIPTTTGQPHGNEGALL